MNLTAGSLRPPQLLHLWPFPSVLVQPPTTFIAPSWRVPPRVTPSWLLCVVNSVHKTNDFTTAQAIFRADPLVLLSCYTSGLLSTSSLLLRFSILLSVVNIISLVSCLMLALALFRSDHLRLHGQCYTGYVFNPWAFS